MHLAWHAYLTVDIMQNLHSASTEDEIYVGVRESLGFFCLSSPMVRITNNPEVAESYGFFFFVS